MLSYIAKHRVKRRSKAISGSKDDDEKEPVTRMQPDTLSPRAERPLKRMKPPPPSTPPPITPDELASKALSGIYTSLGHDEANVIQIPFAGLTGHKPPFIVISTYDFTTLKIWRKFVPALESLGVVYVWNKPVDPALLAKHKFVVIIKSRFGCAEWLSKYEAVLPGTKLFVENLPRDGSDLDGLGKLLGSDDERSPALSPNLRPQPSPSALPYPLKLT